MKTATAELKIKITAYCPHCEEILLNDDIEKQLNVNSEFDFFHHDKIDDFEPVEITCTECNEKFIINNLTY